MIFLGQRLKIHTEDGIGAGGLPAAGLNGAVKNGLILIRDHQILISDQLEAQTGTSGTGAAGIIEGEHSRFQLRQRYAAILAGIILGEGQFFLRGGQLNGDQTTGMYAGGFNGIGQAAAQAFLQHKTVHHQLNGMLFVFLAGYGFCQVI